MITTLTDDATPALASAGVTAPFAVRLPVFEGPFDLLLYFIERDELDIGDIPIARITDEFLAYLRQMERLNLEVASEFLLVAATLMRIKVRMLLPRPTLDAQGQEIDPRQELAAHLLEYRRYKDAAAILAVYEQEALARCPRGGVQQELDELATAAADKAPLVNLTLTALTLAYQKALLAQAERARHSHHVVVAVPYTVEQQRAWILARVAAEGPLSLDDVLLTLRDRLEAVHTLMAILELLAERSLSLEPAGPLDEEVGQPEGGWRLSGVSLAA